MRKPRLIARSPFTAVYQAATVPDDARDEVRARLAEGWGCDPEAVTVEAIGQVLVFSRVAHLRKVSTETSA